MIIKIKNLGITGIFLMLMATINAFGQQLIPLYEGKIPNSIKTANKEYETSWHFLAKVSQPTLTIYTPPLGSANGTAVIVCPGGGYAALNIKMEGYSVAERLNRLGITAFVLKYRIPDDSTMVDKTIGPLQDAQRAILIVKSRAKEWKIDSTKVGIIGFSAGGHLACSTGTHFNKSFIDNPENINLRPDFMILVYPVISFTDSIGHIDSRTALIGKNPSNEKIAFFSNEMQVSSNTPPTFLIHASDDGLVSVKNSVAFYLALQRNKVSAGLHIFPKGEHGFFLPPANTNWFQYCAQWLQENGWVKQLSVSNN
jgi:acetyl esterase/lipase